MNVKDRLLLSGRNLLGSLARDASAEEDTVTFRWRGDEIADVSSGGPYMEPHPALCRLLLQEGRRRIVDG